MSSGAGPGPDHSPDSATVTPEQLADLQAGLLDDATAAHVRRQARTDPDAARTLAGLDTVRRELAGLGSGAGTAPEVPADVTARVSAALRDAPRPGGTHAVARPTLTRTQCAGLLLGLGAAAAAVVVGTLTVLREPAPAFPPGPTASEITVAGPGQRAFPLSGAELQAALNAPADLGPLTDPQRRASCLAGLGYAPALEVLGGRPLEVAGQPAILLLLPGPGLGQVAAVAVVPTCSAANTGLLTRTVMQRP